SLNKASLWCETWSGKPAGVNTARFHFCGVPGRRHGRPSVAHPMAGVVIKAENSCPDNSNGMERIKNQVSR
ncbi:MAG: hypothetical protein R6V54_06290, partial [Desulfobacteraceae bacterium]